MSGWRSYLDTPHGEEGEEPTPTGLSSSMSGNDDSSPFRTRDAFFGNDESAYHADYVSGHFDVSESESGQSSAPDSAYSSMYGDATHPGSDHAPDPFSSTKSFSPTKSSSRAAVCVAVIVAIIVAFVAASFIIPRAKAPHELIASYVWAVSKGDFERATELANPNVPQSSRALLASDVLDADHRITQYDIGFGSESFAPFRYSVRVFYIVGSEEGKQYADSVTLSLRLNPNGSWVFERSLLNALELPRSAQFTVNGVSVSDTGFDPRTICSTSDSSCRMMRDTSDDDFCVPAYPGIYSVGTPLPADNPELFTIVQQDVRSPYVSLHDRASGASDNDGTADSSDSDAADSGDNSDDNTFKYGQTRSSDGTWIAVVESTRPYSFSIDVRFTDIAKVSVLKQLDAHTRSCVSKVNAHDLSDATCTFISEEIPSDPEFEWHVSYTRGELKGDLLNLFRCKPSNDGTVACEISDSVSSEVVINVTHGDYAFDPIRGCWHSWDDTVVVKEGSVAPVLATS